MRSLTIKFILAFLAVSLTGTVLVAIFGTLSTNRQFTRFVVDQGQENTAALLADSYGTYGNWSAVIANVPTFADERGIIISERWSGLPPFGGPPAYFTSEEIPEGFPTPSAPPDYLRPGIGGPGNPGFVVLFDNQGQALVMGQGYNVGDPLQTDDVERTLPIEVDGQAVGTVLFNDFPASREVLVQGAGELFLSRITQTLGASALLATAVGLVLGVFLARNLTGPLKEMRSAAQAIAKGDLEQSVPVRTQDELGELAATFNQMSSDLARSQRVRRQMTADIAHDLRTPLSIILGHAEALSDGVLPATPETLDVIYDEAQRLNRLVDDLRTLSLAEAGELSLTRRPVAPKAVLERAATAHGPNAARKGVTLTVEAAADLPEIEADPDRLAQVLDNLLSNALRFTPEKGAVSLSAVSPHKNGVIQISVQDSGLGIAAEDLPHIFNRFFRADKSRQRHDGGSGLGLAIARSIVEAHEGRIWAESVLGEGMKVVIELGA